ncbi:MAG TPA: carboxypeptidase-like regulatory domain-containing protein [Flavobacteriaceae bacterium]|nr:carboxypeptidase-like regulatory domain-containing protein [Flavobacteriaceae bacterium]
MKQLLLLFLLFTPIFSFAQNRVEIEGKINVPLNAEASGIAVYNLNSRQGTVTDDYGAFSIAAKLNDSLSISSVQYEPFVVIIDQGVIDTKTLTIAVREAVTQLDEVIVRPYDLSGNVSVDIEKVATSSNPLKMGSRQIVTTDPSYGYDEATPLERTMDDPFLRNGIQFVNIFKAIFKNDDRNKKNVSRQHVDMDVQIRKMYNDDFFQEYIDIEKEEINEFIFYAERNGLSNELLQKGNELDLIEFLIAQGKAFKKEN